MTTIMRKETMDKMGDRESLAESLGGRPMLAGDNMAADQADAARASALAAAGQADEQLLGYKNRASLAIADNLTKISGDGSIQQYREQMEESMRSASDRVANGPGKLGPPTFPGSVYLNHLFKRTKAEQKAKKDLKKSKGEEINIYTEHMEALKSAISSMGVYSDRNPGGMPIDIKEAKKIWFGGEQIDGIQENEWRSLVEMGDNSIDPKKIRKFVNYDGSRTWEVLNDDKTVSSRFTMGEHSGVKVFAQGGYAKFAEILKKVKEKAQGGGDGGFDAARSSFGGG